ncbi:hypothetical protein JMUB7518_27820 [Staphylococcus aureus]
MCIRDRFDGEAPGQIGWSNELQQKTSSFGQSTTVTPVQMLQAQSAFFNDGNICLLYTSPSPRDYAASRMPSSA